MYLLEEKIKLAIPDLYWENRDDVKSFIQRNIEYMGTLMCRDNQEPGCYGGRFDRSGIKELSCLTLTSFHLDCYSLKQAV